MFLDPKKMFWIRLSFLIVLVIFLIFNLFLAVWDPLPKYAVLDYSDRISNYFAFFTTQSNYFVAIYFFVYLFETKFKKTKPHFVIRLGVVTYITITMLVYWTGIVGQEGVVQQYDAINWFCTTIMHLIMPVTMIVCYIITAGDRYYSYEKHYKKDMWLILLYMFAYMTAVLIRGKIRQLDSKDSQSLFPYFFLNYFNEDGFLMVSISVVLIFLMAISLQYLYIWINNLKYKKYVRNRGIKAEPINFRIICSRKIKIGLILGYIAIVISFTVNFLVLYIRVIFTSIFPENTEEMELILYAFLALSFACLICYIVMSIFAFKGNAWARIACGIILCALTFLTWFTIVGPILMVIGALMLFTHRETISDTARDEQEPIAISTSRPTESNNGETMLLTNAVK